MVGAVEADGILALCASYEPDVIVCDEANFGALVAAERLGLPHATVLVIAAGSFVRAEVVPEPTTGRAPDWLEALDGATAVYVTLGTVFNLESRDLFARVLAGLRDVPVHLVVTVGHEIYPVEFGPQPDNAHIERYVPPVARPPSLRCHRVPCRLGPGDGDARARPPLVLVPLGADQPLNAARCAALGLGRELDPSTPPQPTCGRP